MPSHVCGCGFLFGCVMVGRASGVVMVLAWCFGWLVPQMAIENSVSKDFSSTFVDSINFFDCRLPGVKMM